MVREEKVCLNEITPRNVLTTKNSSTGGKAKPLKAAKKEKKELDEDDIAFKERQKAGTSCLSSPKALYGLSS